MNDIVFFLKMFNFVGVNYMECIMAEPDIGSNQYDWFFSSNHIGMGQNRYIGQSIF